MRAILINATDRTVTEVEIDGGFRSIQKALGVDCFTIAGHMAGDSRWNDLYVDDEGLLKAPRDFFHLLGCYPTPLAGNGLLVGSRDTDEGTDSADCTLDLETVRNLTTFVGRPKVAA